ncbi:hypothetical protein GCM10010174_89050 [Kutzneria viridogrisea]|uniref:Secreted protein n=2 Tax=Kutzneria TaxID=43356 RepID=W5WNI0_9PSEU|nr:hypothetical protein [Kutzneria albida]AHI02102.1 hypothetical protein KALB_8745 [Kutzneria albida DSM 43870]MBA8929337.1 hypothetical protein [Kutzneria viridogrisea]
MGSTRTGRILVLTALVLACTQAGAAADPAPPPAPVSGGSNYDFYSLDDCYREPYQVVRNFDKVPDIVRYQLTGMHSGGQNRISLGLYHHHGAATGTVVDSTGGKLPEQDRSNLTGLLSTVKQVGFAEITVVLHPLAPNDPHGWASWQPELYQENWQFIQDLHAVVAGAGLPYHLDLGSELTASTGQSVVLQYDQQLWKDYTAKFGRTDTVGFSVNSQDWGSVLNLGKVYGTSPPPLFDVHVYGDEYDQFVSVDNGLRQFGYTTQPFIIGESYYNDAEAAAGLAKATRATGRQVYYLTQWQRTRANNTQCADVDVAPPNDFSAYTKAGF